MTQPAVRGTMLARKMIFILCILQPVLSVLSYWLIALGMQNDLTLGLRMAVLAAVVCTSFVLSEKKPVYVLLCTLGAMYYALHGWACWRAGSFTGISPVISDLVNYVRVFQIPLLALSMMTLLKRAGDNGRSLEQGLVWTFVIITVVELLSVITDTNPYTYANKSIGLVGWFFFPNAQSAVLSMLIPLVLVIAMEKGNALQFVCAAVAGFLELYLFATRLSYLAIFIAAAGISVFTIAFLALHRANLENPKNIRKYPQRIGVILVCAAVCAAGFRVSPMYRNQEMVQANAVVKQQELDALVEEGTALYGEEGIEHLIPAYEYRQKNLLDRFGAERVITLYGGSTEVSVIVDDRARKLNYCRLLLEDSPVTSRLFGLAYSEMIWNGENFDVENDFHGIAYLYGYVGLGLLVLMLAWFFLRVLCLLVRDYRACLTPRMGALGAALLSGMAHAYATAGMLRRPNASFYLSLALAALWMLTKMPRHTSHGDVCDEPAEGGDSV